MKFSKGAFKDFERRARETRFVLTNSKGVTLADGLQMEPHLFQQLEAIVRNKKIVSHKLHLSPSPKCSTHIAGNSNAKRKTCTGPDQIEDNGDRVN